MKKVHTDTAPMAIGPYSQAIVHNGLVYTSGQIAIDPLTNEFIGGTIGSQTEMVLENIKSILEEAGSSTDGIIKVTVYLKDINEFGQFNSVYQKHIKHMPARTTVEVSNLPRNAKIELDTVAEIREELK
jgi:2-iminobutanoate/2-iminopropanoate deaminase